MLVYYAGEDEVTKLIAKRLIEYAAQLEGIHDISLDDANPRDRGTKALDKLDTTINLSEYSPVVCVFDADNNCVVELLKKYTSRGWKKERLAINFAIDEGEAWLMADRNSFANYFGLKVSSIPKKKKNAKELSESISYKTSLFFLNEMVGLSRKRKLISKLTDRQPNRKPAMYNTVWPSYILDCWNIEMARKNSESLSRAVERTRIALRAADCH